MYLGCGNNEWAQDAGGFATAPKWSPDLLPGSVAHWCSAAHRRPRPSSLVPVPVCPCRRAPRRRSRQLVSIVSSHTAMLEKPRPSAIPRDAHSHLDMSEDTKSTAAKAKGGRRFLYIANPGSDESSGEEDNKRSEAESSSNPQGFNYQQPPPLPSLPSQTRTAKPTRPQYAPSPLTTNLPLDHGHHYPSSRSNPTLSSPSSTSSPAVESTPPPSTPSLGAPVADLPGEPSIKQEPPIGASLNERTDGTHVTVRPTGLFEKFKAHLPHRSSLQQRTSTNTLISNTVCQCAAL